MKARKKTAALQLEFNNFLADVESLLKETASLTGEEFAEAREKLQDRVSQAKESVVDVGEDLARRARKTANKVNRDAHDEPWKAVGIGAAAGLMLGMLFARR